MFFFIHYAQDVFFYFFFIIFQPLSKSLFDNNIDFAWLCTCGFSIFLQSTILLYQYWTSTVPINRSFKRILCIYLFPHYVRSNIKKNNLWALKGQRSNEVVLLVITFNSLSYIYQIQHIISIIIRITNVQ